MGPLLLSRMLELNDVQEGVLTVVFRAADEEGLLLLDLEGPAGGAHLRRPRTPRSCRRQYGNVSPATVATIQRKLLVLEDQGGGALLRRAGAAARRT